MESPGRNLAVIWKLIKVRLGFGSDMMFKMKFSFVLAAIFLLSVSVVSAYDLTVTELEKPYDLVPLNDNLLDKQVFLGELDDFPIMYGFTIGDETTNFKTVIRQRYEGDTKPIDFSLILIRQNDNNRGVTEIARLRLRTEDWTIVKDKTIGMTFWESPLLDNELQSGSYRLEISTPDNIGRFMLTFGESDNDGGYFKELGNVYTTQKFFGHSFLKLLSSTLVYYLLGIIFLLFVIQKTWKYRNSIKHAG